MTEVSDQIHPDFRETIAALIDGLLTDYPMVTVAAVRLGDPGEGDTSMGEVDGREIVLNPNLFGVSRETLDAMVAAGRECQIEGLPRFHGGMGEPNHAVIHEFGHLLRLALGDRALGFAKNGLIEGRADPTKAATGYACADEEEWFADTFAALRMGVAGRLQVSEMAAFLAAATRDYKIGLALAALDRAQAF